MNRVFDQLQILGERNTQCIRHLERPTLAEECNGLSSGREQFLEILIFSYRVAGFARRPERHDSRVFKGYGLDHAKEFDVLGIRAGPAALNEVHTEFIQLLRNTKLILHGETDILRLSPVPQGGIVDFKRRRLRRRESRHRNRFRTARAPRRCIATFHRCETNRVMTDLSRRRHTGRYRLSQTSPALAPTPGPGRMPCEACAWPIPNTFPR